MKIYLTVLLVAVLSAGVQVAYAPGVSRCELLARGVSCMVTLPSMRVVGVAV